jgi:hypothetical protein
VGGTLSTGAAVALGEDVTNLGLWVRFAAVISELLQLVSPGFDRRQIQEPGGFRLSVLTIASPTHGFAEPNQKYQCFVSS